MHTQASGRNVTAMLQAPLALALVGRRRDDDKNQADEKEETALLHAMRLVLFSPGTVPRAERSAARDQVDDDGTEESKSQGRELVLHEVPVGQAAAEAAAVLPNWEEPWVVEGRQWATAALMSVVAAAGKGPTTTTTTTTTSSSSRGGEAAAAAAGRWPLVLYLLDSLEARRRACVAGGRVDYTEGRALDAAMRVSGRWEDGRKGRREAVCLSVPTSSSKRAKHSVR